ncbi:hypothetical protein PoB_003944100 [Plakobranchus ocellatus]|uniref:Uncharacterized protein n=1 Tax=Plakobranchus ocellatus TaxID=259542 RepID=A0AAV4AXH4_9GAST|nr:hypothetical protein PoB_003944100 [Plakobranchus ocellatus]
MFKDFQDIKYFTCFLIASKYLLDSLQRLRGTVDSVDVTLPTESALRSAGTLLSRVRAPHRRSGLMAKGANPNSRYWCDRKGKELRPMSANAQYFYNYIETEYWSLTVAISQGKLSTKDTLFMPGIEFIPPLDREHF